MIQSIMLCVDAPTNTQIASIFYHKITNQSRNQKTASLCVLLYPKRWICSASDRNIMVEPEWGIYAFLERKGVYQNEDT